MKRLIYVQMALVGCLTLAGDALAGKAEKEAIAALEARVEALEASAAGGPQIFDANGSQVGELVSVDLPGAERATVNCSRSATRGRVAGSHFLSGQGQSVRQKQRTNPHSALCAAVWHTANCASQTELPGSPGASRHTSTRSATRRMSSISWMHASLPARSAQGS